MGGPDASALSVDLEAGSIPPEERRQLELEYDEETHPEVV